LKTTCCNCLWILLFIKIALNESSKYEQLNLKTKRHDKWNMHSVFNVILFYFILFILAIYFRIAGLLVDHAYKYDKG